MRNKPLVAVSMGDPCGVGPEIIVKALASPDLFEHCLPVVIGEVRALERAVDQLESNTRIRVGPEIESLVDYIRPGTICVLSRSDLAWEDIAYGKPSQATCRAVIHYIEEAARLALAGRVDAVCTCPIHKANLQKAGFAFAGHTEFLQEITRAKDVVMMLAGPRLRVSLVTIHQALIDVPKTLTAERISRTIAVTAEALAHDFGLEPVRIGVAGLNPHAGEWGRFGREELEIIQPVIEEFQGSPYHVAGPFSPDTLFFRAFEGEFDAVVAMYHDQGLIPIKMVHFYEAVNVTLGLPIVRTSVDHGTAYELAGTGKAHPGSLDRAVRLAAGMVRNRRLRAPHDQI